MIGAAGGRPASGAEDQRKAKDDRFERKAVVDDPTSEFIPCRLSPGWFLGD